MAGLVLELSIALQRILHSQDALDAGCCFRLGHGYSKTLSRSFKPYTISIKMNLGTEWQIYWVINSFPILVGSEVDELNLDPINVTAKLLSTEGTNIFLFA